MKSIENLQTAFKRYIKFKKSDDYDTVPQNFWGAVSDYWSDTEGNEQLNNNSARKRFGRRYRKLKRAFFSDDVLEDILTELSKDDRNYYGDLDEDEVEDIKEEKEKEEKEQFDPKDSDYESKDTVNDEQNNKSYRNYEKGTVSAEGDRITTLEELLEFSEVDREVYDIERHLVNSWEVTSWKRGFPETKTNFQVKAWLKNKFFRKVDENWVQSYFDRISNYLPKVEVERSFDKEQRDKPLVCAIADLHAGGFTENMKLVEDYNLDVLKKKIARITKIIKRTNRPVHVKILGDLIESFTGKNHKNTWKQIEMHGMKVMFVVADMIGKMLREAPNIVSVDLISGNHDRISASNEDDVEGQVAYGVAELLRRQTEGIKIDYDPLILSHLHEDVNYILLHGHLPIAKKNPAEIVLDYGKQDYYNVILTAHYHSELIKKNTTKLRVHQVPSLVPANQFAQNLGAHAPTGFLLFETNQFGNVDTQSKSV